MLFGVWFLLTNILGSIVTSKTNIATGVTMTLFGVLLGILITASLCLFVYHGFSCFMKLTLPQTIRLNEAMRMLHATTTLESLATIKFYKITIFKSKIELGTDIEERVSCKAVSAFLAPWMLRAHQDAALGSAFYCCDYEQIQRIISANKVKWGGNTEPANSSPAEINNLKRVIIDLEEKKKEITGKYTAANGRASQLQKCLEEVENHMGVIVELAHKVSTEIKPPHNITEKEIKSKYLAIGKIYGINTVPGAYMEIFRKRMPKEIINQGGAPKAKI